VERMKSRVILELYHDSTVEPFENPRFNTIEVMKMLKEAEIRGFIVKIVDTAGWSRELLMERYKQIVRRCRKGGGIFGPRNKRGWFFGREVPALIILTEGGKPELYPAQIGNSLITISEILKKLLSKRGGDGHLHVH